MTTVAVGYDFSQNARRAAQWAAAYAQCCGADVVLVHAIGLREHATSSNPLVGLAEIAAEIAAGAGLEESRVRGALDYGDACSVLLRCGGSPINASMPSPIAAHRTKRGSKKPKSEEKTLEISLMVTRRSSATSRARWTAWQVCGVA